MPTKLLTFISATNSKTNKKNINKIYFCSAKPTHETKQKKERWCDENLLTILIQICFFFLLFCCLTVCRVLHVFVAVFSFACFYFWTDFLSPCLSFFFLIFIFIQWYSNLWSTKCFNSFFRIGIAFINIFIPKCK